MANEASKQMIRRSADRRFMTRWVVGTGIDIGCGTDPLSKLSDFFPLMKSLRPWDLPDGDAMVMSGVKDRTYDFVHSSHCLEHLHDPYLALSNWIRICKDGGHLIITVPDEDLYEQGVWPSTFNSDHKWSFTIHKSSSWAPHSINVLALLERFQDQVEILKIEKLDSGFNYTLPRHDQTQNVIAESAIEFVLKKKPIEERNYSGEPGQDISMRFAEAVKAHELQVKFSEAIAFHQTEHLDEARICYEAILQAYPDNQSVLNNLALLSPPDLAETYLRKALAIGENYIDAMVNLARLLLDSHKVDEAKILLRRALQLEPKDKRIVFGLCQAYEMSDDFDAAIRVLNESKESLDRLDEIYCRLGKYAESANRTDEALAYFLRAQELNPVNAESHIYAGRQFLRKGDYVKGAEEIAWIWRDRIPSSQIGLFVNENGTGIRQLGKTILLSADSGLGDTLQFIRYAKLLKDLGATVIVECQHELLRLFRNMPEIDHVDGVGNVSRRFDVRIPLHNLIGAFRTTVATIPNTFPYVKAYADEANGYRKRMDRYKGIKVGLCWSGNPNHPRNTSRSIPVGLLSPLLSEQGFVFFSLQQNGNTEGVNLIDWSHEFKDMANTAALVQHLDLVITVDSAIAHLAGAIGRPVWLLNRFDSCWRWLENRSDSPWYPTLTQFSQSKPKLWLDVLEDVQIKLRDLRTH